MLNEILGMYFGDKKRRYQEMRIAWIDIAIAECYSLDVVNNMQKQEIIMKRYAIFDMDGTLIDSIGRWGEVCRACLAEWNVVSDARYLAAETGPMTFADAVAFLIKTYALPVSAEECEKMLKKASEQMYFGPIPEKDGIRNYLTELKRYGVQMCVVSATPKYLVDACLECIGLLTCFDFTLSCEEVGAGKENPAAFLKAAERFGAKPEEIAVFDDSYGPLLTAKKAGFYTVAVYDAYASRWNDSVALADRVVMDWNEAKKEAR